MKKITALFIVLILAFSFVITASAATVLKGDVDTNGKITAMDARIILRAAARLEEISETQKIIADVTGDTKVTASDARIVLRRAANIEKDLGTVEIEERPAETTTAETTVAPVERVELSSGIAMNYRSFMDKFGAMRKVGRADSVIEYTNDKMTIISDPYMIYEGNVSAIIIEGGDYTINGIYVTMSRADALAKLKSDKWIVKEEGATEVRLTRNAMYMELTISDNTVIKVEYGFIESLLPPDERPTETTTVKPEPSTAETTTAKPEPSTAETTTAETTTAETTTDETTTKKEEPSSDEKPTARPDGPVEYDDLPKQIKCFLEGNFGIIGFNYSNGNRNAVEMYITPDNIKAGMSLDTENGSIALDILIKDVSGKSKTYIVIPGQKIFCELNAFAMTMLGIKPDDLKIDFSSDGTEYRSIVKTTERSVGVDYDVYTISTEKEYCKIFTTNEEIKRIETYSMADGTMKSRIDVTTFITDVPADKFSLNGYKQKSFLEVFGEMLM